LRQKDVAIVADQAPVQWLEENQISGVMVRPDRYVLGAARNSHDMDSLIAAI
jgi:3-(3-hydroxy-phenyl)propionate hydroxylase